MIVVGGWPGRNVVGLNGRFGVRPADFAVAGDFDNPFVDDVDPGDETTEFVGVVQSLPASGTVVFDDDGGFEHTGAADGTYSTVFTLYTWAQGGPVTQHTPNETIETSFGGNASAAGVTLIAAASLISGAASGATSGTAPGATLTAIASVIAGAASGTGAGTAAGATLQAAASLLLGAASAEGNASAPGAIIAAAASLLAGTAEASDSATAQGALLQAAASLIAGAASGQADATAPGATFTAFAALLAGGAFGPSTSATPGYSARADSTPRRATITDQKRTARRTLQ